MLTIREWCCIRKWVLSWGLVEKRHTSLFPYLPGCVQLQNTDHFLYDKDWKITSKNYSMLQGVFNRLASMQPSTTYCMWLKCFDFDWLNKQPHSSSVPGLINLFVHFNLCSDFIHWHAKRLDPGLHLSQTPSDLTSWWRWLWCTQRHTHNDMQALGVSHKYLSLYVSVGMTIYQSPCLELPVYVKKENWNESWRITLGLLGLQGWLKCWLG